MSIMSTLMSNSTLAINSTHQHYATVAFVPETMGVMTKLGICFAGWVALFALGVLTQKLLVTKCPKCIEKCAKCCEEYSDSEAEDDVSSKSVVRSGSDYDNYAKTEEFNTRGPYDFRPVGSSSSGYYAGGGRRGHYRTDSLDPVSEPTLKRISINGTQISDMHVDPNSNDRSPPYTSVRSTSNRLDQQKSTTSGSGDSSSRRVQFSPETQGRGGSFQRSGSSGSSLIILPANETAQQRTLTSKHLSAKLERMSEKSQDDEEPA